MSKRNHSQSGSDNVDNPFKMATSSDAKKARYGAGDAMQGD